MDYQKTAESILAAVGGAKNVAHLHHCATRLRFTLNDPAKADEVKIKTIPGVLSTVSVGGQPQVVIGNSVVDVYQAMVKLPGMNAASGAGAPKAKMGPVATVLDFLVGVFQPLVPAMAGAGILRSMLLLAVAFGWATRDDPTFQVFFNLSGAVFYFLPLMVAVTAATKLGSNRMVALATTSLLLFPAMVAAMENQATMFGIAIPNVDYSSQVFPPILIALVLAGLEKFWTRWSPKPIRVFFVPMMSMVVAVPLALFVLGPIGYWGGVWFTAAIVAMHGTLGGFAVAILAVLLPFLISIGMHKALTPYAIQMIQSKGGESLLLPALLAHNLAQAGSSFAVALRTKDKELRSVAMSGGISAFFGITEPALYGVTLQNKRALASVLAGAAAGGAYAGFTGIVGHVVVTPAMATLSMFAEEGNSWNLINALITVAIALGVSFAVSAALWSDADSATLKARADVIPPEAQLFETEEGPVDLGSPVDGEVIDLSEVPDRVFAGGALGKGCGIRPSSGEFRSPAAGTVAMLFDTRHAVAITTDSGADILIHIGLDTVRLDGKPFTAHVAKGDRVDAGQLLISADLEQIEAAGYDTTTPIVVTNSDKFEITGSPVGATLRCGDPLFTVQAKEPVSA